MTPDQHLETGLTEWMQLASIEAEAIRERDWRRLSSSQERIRKLQGQLIELARDTREIWSQSGAEGAQKESRLQNRIIELMELERQNGALLREAQDASLNELKRSKLVAKTLRRLRASYVSGQPANWTSFS